MKLITTKMCAATLALLSISACASAPKTAPPAVDPMLAEIRRHAEHVSVAMAGLMSQGAMNGGVSEQVPPATYPLERMPLELQALIEMDWHGELEPAVESVAHFVGWRFTVVGARPLSRSLFC
jgi:hypothetical protein